VASAGQAAQAATQAATKLPGAGGGA
jgi:hypothetical protein